MLAIRFEATGLEKRSSYSEGVLTHAISCRLVLSKSSRRIIEFNGENADRRTTSEKVIAIKRQQL